MVNWIFPAIQATIFGGIYSTFIKINQNYYETYSIIGFILFINFVMIQVYNYFSGIKNSFEKFSIGAGIAYGLTMFYFNKALESTNNPGVPTALARTQIVLTYMASLYFFKAKFNIYKLVSIIVIIIGSIVAVLGQFEQITTGSWLVETLLASFWSSANDIFSKSALNRTINNNYLRIEMLSATIVVVIIQYIRTKTVGIKERKNKEYKSKIKILNEFPGISLVICLLSQFFMLYYIGVSFNNTNNPAYPRAIFNASFIVTLISSLIIEKGSSINKMEVLGSIIILIGAAGTALL